MAKGIVAKLRQIYLLCVKNKSKKNFPESFSLVRKVNKKRIQIIIKLDHDATARQLLGPKKFLRVNISEILLNIFSFG